MAYLITVEIYKDEGKWRALSAQMPMMNFFGASSELLLVPVYREVRRLYGGDEVELRIIVQMVPEEIDEEDYMAVGDDGLGW